jgi:NADPH:quinone reductase-like Zn-dependent oxidoreductase
MIGYPQRAISKSDAEQRGTVVKHEAWRAYEKLASVGSRRDMEQLLAFVENHRISPIIDAKYRFDALPDALDHLDRGPFGKIVVEIN